MGIVLKGGKVVSALDVIEADVRIEDEKIAAIGHKLDQMGDRVLNVEDCFLFPGGIDPHTHFDLPFGDYSTSDDFFLGTRAALLGGTTTVIDYATQFKGETLTEALQHWHRKADNQCFTDYGFHLAITDWNPLIAEQLRSVVQNDGVSSFKLYMAYKGTLQVEDGVLFEVLQNSQKVGALICLHCENGDIIQKLVQQARRQGHLSPQYHSLTRPVEVEKEATSRAVSIAEFTGAPLYVVHLTCEESLNIVALAKRRGSLVFAETCPQYLLLDEKAYDFEGFEGAKYVISPPLRSKRHQEKLWLGLKNGLLDTLATDHCSFNFVGHKDLGINDFSLIPNGIPGVETRMGLLYTYGVETGRITINEFVNLTSTRAAQLFGLYPRKGVIALGSDADIVVWDPNISKIIEAKSLHQNVDYCPYEGFPQKGGVKHIFLRGHEVVSKGKIKGPPQGIYLFRKPFRF
jgi:dihydropyrimidinase